jgi:hypothetical protein
MKRFFLYARLSVDFYIRGFGGKFHKGRGKERKLLLLYSRVVRRKIFHTAHLLSGDEREIDGGEGRKRHEDAVEWREKKPENSNPFSHPFSMARGRKIQRKQQRWRSHK